MIFAVLDVLLTALLPFIMLFLVLAVANLSEKFEVCVYSHVPEIRWDAI